MDKGTEHEAKNLSKGELTAGKGRWSNDFIPNLVIAAPARDVPWERQVSQRTVCPGSIANDLANWAGDRRQLAESAGWSLQ